MPPKIVTYLPYSEFNDGRKCTRDEFRSTLSRFSRNRVLYICSVINAILKSWEGHLDREAHDEVVQSAFPPEMANPLIALGRSEARPRAVFHRQQILFVAKEALACCKEQGVDPFRLRYLGGLGIVFLMANDLLPFDYPEANSTDEKLINTLAEFIPIMEYSGWLSFENKIVRSHLMLTQFLNPLRDHADFIDIPSRFEQLTGTSSAQYQALCFAALSKYMRMDLASYRANPQGFLLPRTFFQNTALSQDRVDRFLEDLSQTPQNLRTAFEKRDHGANDFTWFRDKPLLRDGPSFYSLDTAFLAEKIETGPFWRVHNSLGTSQEKQKLHRFWGVVFESYMNWLLARCVEGRNNIFYADPRYSSDPTTQVCDALIMCGPSVVLLEYKGSTFTAAGKYSGDRELLAEEIESKLIGTEENKKGIRQLANAVCRLFGKGSKDSVEGLDLSTTRTIYPVLVTRDDLGGALLINILLNRRFQKLFNKKRVRPRIVTPLFFLSADAVEHISAYLREASLARILEARYRADRTLMSTFLAVDNSVLRDIGQRRNEELRRGFEDFSRGVARELFPNGVP